MTAHALPEVTKAVTEQAGRIIHSSTLYLNRPMVELAEQIAAVSGIPDAKVFLTTAAPRPTTPRCCWPARCAGRTRSWRCATATTAGRSRRSRSPGTGAGRPRRSRRSRPTTCTAGSGTARPYADLSDGEYIAACVADLRDVLDQSGGDVAGAHRRADPGRRRVHLGPDGLLRRVREGPARARDPVDLRRGADRLGAHRRALLGLAGPRRGDPDLVTFAKGIGNGLSMAGVIARGRRSWTRLGANSISTFGGSPLTAAGRAGQPPLPARPRPAGERGTPRTGADRRAARRVDAPIVGDVRGKGLMIGVELVRPGTGTARRRRRPSSPTPCSRRRGGAGCWSARAACTATCCASPRRSPSPPTRPRRGWQHARRVEPGGHPVSRTLVRNGLVITASDEIGRRRADRGREGRRARGDRINARRGLDRRHRHRRGRQVRHPRRRRRAHPHGAALRRHVRLRHLRDRHPRGGVGRHHHDRRLRRAVDGQRRCARASTPGTPRPTGSARSTTPST